MIPALLIKTASVSVWKAMRLGSFTIQSSISVGNMVDDRRDLLVVGDVEPNEIDLSSHPEVFKLLDRLFTSG